MILSVTLYLVDLIFVDDLLFFVFRLIATFISDLFQVYSESYFTYLEINPLGKFG